MNRIIVVLLLLSTFWQSSNVFAQGYDCDEPIFPRYDKKTRLWGYTSINRQYIVPPTYTQAWVHQERYAIVLMGTKYGIIDCNGTLVVPAEYDDIMYFNSGRGWAKKDNQWALITNKNKQLTPHIFADIKPVSERRSPTWVKKGTKWGMFDKDNVKYIIDPQFDAVNSLGDSAAIVKKGNQFAIVDYDYNAVVLDNIEFIFNITENYLAYRRAGKWGVIGKSARSLLVPKYDTVYKEGEFFVTQLNGKYGLYSLRGKQAIDEQLTAVGKANEGFLPYQKDGKWGFARIARNPLSETLFTQAGFVQDSVAIVKYNGKFDLYRPSSKRFVATKFAYDSIYRSFNNRIIIAVKDGQHFIVGNEGNRRQSGNYSMLFSNDTLAMMRFKQGNSWGYINAGTGNEIGSAFTEVQEAYFGFGIAAKAGKKGVVNAQGKEIVPFGYDKINIYKRGNTLYFQVWNTDKCGLIDGLGNRILPEEYNLISVEGNFIKVAHNKGYGVADIKGNLLQKPEFAFMANQNENGMLGFSFPTLVQKRSKFGILIKPGVEPTNYYDSLKILTDAMFAAKTKGGWQLINSQGQVKGVELYQQLEPFAGRIAPAMQNGKWGFVSQAGNWVIKPQYQAVLPFQKALTYVKLNSKWGVINMQGQWIQPAEYTGWEEIAGIRRLIK